MTIYSGFADSPERIKREGAEVTIKLLKSDDGTGTITWTIPSPVSGCGTDAAPAYDGIVITIDTKPADYINTSPKNGIFYNADPVADRDIHLGDKLDTALIIGAFYNDRKTTSLVVTGLKPRTAYYVSGYAVDNIGTYFREGVHAYSLPTGTSEHNKSTDDLEAFQDISIDELGGASINATTGLSTTEHYDFVINVHGKEYKIVIDGAKAQSYNSLIDAINTRFKLLEDSIKSPPYPNAGGYYFDYANRKLYQWDGKRNVELSVTASTIDPSIPIPYTVWFNPDTRELFVYEGGVWNKKNYIEHPTDPTDLECDQLWFTGTEVYQWRGNRWCKLCLYVQTRNPILGPMFTCDTYWFDTENKQFFSYNEKVKTWDEVLAIISQKNPNDLNTGDNWYNETDERVYQYVAGSWNLLDGVRYEERDENGELPYTAPNSYWFIPSELKLYQRDNSNSEWVELLLTINPTDPKIRKSCDLWLDDSLDEYKLYSWDIINEDWVQVERFIQTKKDPSIPQELEDCAVWYNPITKKLKIINGVTCDDADYIQSDFDPSQAHIYEYWLDANGGWHIWEGDYWTPFDPIISSIDPFLVVEKQFWFDLNGRKLYQWQNGSWVEINYSDTPLVPTVGEKWFDTVGEELYTWNGSEWEPYEAFAGIRFIACATLNPSCRSVLQFYTKSTGCNSYIELKLSDDNLFRSLGHGLIYHDPISGMSGIDAGPTYLQLGVGDDGSPDERRMLHDNVRSSLGAPSVTIELTKEQIDDSINNALLMIRKYSNVGYRRGFFFLDVRRNQQTYLMTNKCVGFNKIVDIMGIHRMGTAFFRTAFGGNDAFGIAALQQLYTVGSFDMLSYHLVSSYVEELHTLFASRVRYQWNEVSRELKLFQNFRYNERVLIDAEMERTEQELLTNRETRFWIKHWVLAECKLKLSQVRGKFQQLPGPNGSTALNTQDLINQAKEEMDRLREELLDMGMQDLKDVGLGAQMILG